MGPMKLLRHKDNDRIRLLMRQDKTLKIRANHIGQHQCTCRQPVAVHTLLTWSTSC